MATLDIVTAPHPVLEKQARKVTKAEFGLDLKTLMSNMAETMYVAPGVGLAAPQIGDSRRFVVVDPGERDERGKRLFTMVNPQIVERSKKTIVWRETCLSVPGMEVDVQRSFRVFVRWQMPQDGSPQEEWFEEYEAVIVQHELDHLDGVTILERASRFKRGRWLKRQKKADRLNQEPVLTERP